MAAYRCSLCATAWPTRPRFQVCPVCVEPTDRMGDETPIDEAEAMRLAPEIKAYLDPLPSVMLGKIHMDWNALEREAARRTGDVFGLWTVVDLIQEQHWQEPAPALGW